MITYLTYVSFSEFFPFYLYISYTLDVQRYSEWIYNGKPVIPEIIMLIVSGFINQQVTKELNIIE